MGHGSLRLGLKSVERTLRPISSARSLHICNEGSTIKFHPSRNLLVFYSGRSIINGRQPYSQAGSESNNLSFCLRLIFSAQPSQTNCPARTPAAQSRIPVPWQHPQALWELRPFSPQRPMRTPSDGPVLDDPEFADHIRSQFITGWRPRRARRRDAMGSGPPIKICLGPCASPPGL